MANTRPFTYNNGSTLSGSEQIGDLAIGVTPQDYSSQPGGKEWWMGPDEDNRYIIGKDVPSSDWSTPLGNIGSVRFWATSTESDSEFVDLTNKIGNQTFTTPSECLNWLTTNGYWTNYLGNGNELDSYTFKNLTLSTEIIPGQSIYDSSTGYFIIQNDIGQNTQRPPVVFTPSLFNSYSSGSVISGSNIFLDLDSSYSTSKYYGLTLKSSTSELFSGTSDSRGFTISKWDLTTNSPPYTGSFSPGVTQDVNARIPTTYISYSPKHDLIYAGTTESGVNPEAVLIYSASNLSNFPDAVINWTITGSAGFPNGPVCHAATDNSGKVFIMQTIDTQLPRTIPFAIMSGSEFLYSGSFTENIRSYTEETQVIYDENTEKWFFTAIPYDENGWMIISLDANTYEFESNQITNYNQTQTDGTSLAYDENRNVIWTYLTPRVGSNQLLYAISPTTLQPLKSELPITPTFGLNSPWWVIDPVNNNLHSSGINRYNLNDFWPI
jgi:hypothetical protein